ncbi:uncharacterized protein LOC116379295, partial [Anarrhichthys ocellatus]|uniref:uncharacterized protein LOC116379295 n=1 Tax=Anarrhichthys ocellatus TaxID=433405 RepID=UPI0012EE7FA3
EVNIYTQTAEFLFSLQMETLITDHSVCVKRRMNICSCLLALVLGWNATAEIIHQTVEVKTSVSLRCPHSVESIVTWSRESNGRKVDILTVGVDTDIRHIDDPQKRYSSEADKSLYIRSVTVSDSGIYFCNSEAAVELTVIPPAEGQTTTSTITPKTRPTSVPSTTHLTNEGTTSTTKRHKKKERKNKCNNTTTSSTPTTTTRQTTAATKGTTSTTATTLTTESNTTEDPPPLRLVFGIVAFLLVIIIVVYFAWRRRIERR